MNTTAQTHKARKTHRCSWCDQRINSGETYHRYRWFDGSDASTVKMHPECHEASDRLSKQQGGYIEFEPGEYTRGCTCEAGCCECKT